MVQIKRWPQHGSPELFVPHPVAVRPDTAALRLAVNDAAAIRRLPRAFFEGRGFSVSVASSTAAFRRDPKA